MLKRFKPEQPDGTRLVFNLPDRYTFDTDINLFVNGQLLDTFEDIEHPYGYFLDSHARIFTFYIPPLSDDYLYVMYDELDPLVLSFDNVDWTKKVRKIDFSVSVFKQDWKIETNKVNWDIKPVKTTWDMESKKVEWATETNNINFSFKMCTK